MAHPHSFKGNYNQSEKPKTPFSCTEPAAQLYLISVCKLSPTLQQFGLSTGTNCAQREQQAGSVCGRLKQLYTLVILIMSSRLTKMYFQEKVRYTEIKGFLHLRYFQDAILKYKMFTWASQGALQDGELSQILTAGQSQPCPCLLTCVIVVYLWDCTEMYYLWVVYSLENYLYHH